MFNVKSCSVSDDWFVHDTTVHSHVMVMCQAFHCPSREYISCGTGWVQVSSYMSYLAVFHAQKNQFLEICLILGWRPNAIPSLALRKFVPWSASNDARMPQQNWGRCWHPMAESSLTAPFMVYHNNNICSHSSCYLSNSGIDNIVTTFNGAAECKHRLNENPITWMICSSMLSLRMGYQK